MPPVQVVGDASSPSVSYTLELTSSDGSVALGRMEGSHLSDHPAASEALRGAIKPGARIGGCEIV